MGVPKASHSTNNYYFLGHCIFRNYHISIYTQTTSKVSLSISPKAEAEVIVAIITTKIQILFMLASLFVSGRSFSPHDLQNICKNITSKIFIG
jgi:hypothetical protein